METQGGKRIIALVGAGEIGSRHLQALSTLDLECRIEVFDRSKRALEIARDRFDQANNPRNKLLEVSYDDDIQCLSRHVNLLILATSSSGRDVLLNRILGLAKIDHLILEKVIFQNPDSYGDIASLLEQKGVRAWVNCWPRTMQFFKRIKDSLNEDKKIKMEVAGNRWGLGCNAVHFLDYFSFLRDGAEISHVNCIIESVYSAKREGYIDFLGTVEAENSLGDSIKLKDDLHGPDQITVRISSGEKEYTVVDRISSVLIREKVNGQMRGYTEKFPYQSERTGLIAREILLNNTCDLPPYMDTFKIHEKFIRAVIASMNEKTGKGYSTCPVT